MIIFYGSPSSSATRSQWLLEELGVPYEYRRVDTRKPRAERGDELRQVSPMAKVPALVDGDVRIIESAAINLYLAVVLFGIVLLTCIGTFYREFQTSRVIESLRKMLPEHAHVRRDGVDITVPTADLVPGDIVSLAAGAKVPADIRLLSAQAVKIECSSLTGESVPVRFAAEPAPADTAYSANCNTCLNGTLCLEGSAVGVVVRTGDRTVIGQIAAHAGRTVTVTTTLEREVRRFVWFITALAVVMAAVFFSIGVARKLGTDVLNTFINGFLIIIVANVPQGLPATVVSLLTIVARRLARVHVFVKRLDCVETLGATTVIATDKTGTLTKNQMTVTSLCCEGEFYHGTFDDMFREMRSADSYRQSLEVPGAGSIGGDDAMRSVELRSRAASSRMLRLLRIAALCNKAVIEDAAGGVADTVSGTEDTVRRRLARHQRAPHLRITGNPSDVALLRFVELARPSAHRRRSVRRTV
jgi:sodium/potassium-transporting ATPase subunit alpha